MKKHLLIIVLVVFATLVKAQLVFDAEFRLRSEFRDGVKELSDSTKNPVLINAQRTRFNVGFTDNKLGIYISLYDVRIWGEAIPATDIPSMGIHQAYLSYQFSENLSIQLGRQEISYDNQRFIADNNWNNVAASHDLALIKYKKDKIETHLGLAYNNDKEKNFESDYPLKLYKYLSYLWLKYKLNDNMEVTLLNFYDAFQKTGSYQTIYTRGTSGGFFYYKSEKFNLVMAPFYQYGKSSSGNELSGYFFHVKPTINVTSSLSVSAGLDYYSGSDASDADSKTTAFSNLYGSGHFYLGHMDYFIFVPKNTNQGGMNSVYLESLYKLSDKSTVTVNLHNFRLAGTILDSVSTPGLSVEADKQLGTELDLAFKYRFHPKADFILGYSAMLPSKSMELLKGGDADILQHWFWFSITYKPELYRTTDKKTDL